MQIKKWVACMILLVSWSLYARTQKIPGTDITVIAGNQYEGDTVQCLLDIWTYLDTIATPKVRQRKEFISIIQKGRCEFAMPPFSVAAYVTITLVKGGVREILIGEGLLQPSDQIIIQHKDNWFFAGKGSEKWTALMEMRQAGLVANQQLRSSGMHYMDIRNYAEKYMEGQDIRTAAEIGVLDRYKRRMNKDAYFIMKSDVNSFYGYCKLSPFRNYMGKMIDDSINQHFYSLYKRTWAKIRIDTFHSDMLAHTKNYADFVLMKLNQDRDFDKMSKKPVASIYDMVTTQYQGLLREKLLVLVLLRKLGFKEQENDIDFMMADALHYTTPGFLNDIIKGFKDTFSSGLQVINFQLQDTAGNLVQLTDFKGKVVFVDMWFSGCGACVAVAKALPKVEEAFVNNPNVVFLSVSIDKNKALWMNSINKNGTGYRHYTTETTRYLYTGGHGEDNEFIEKMNPARGYPQVLLIDREGKLYTAVPPRPDGDREQQVIDLINKALKG